MKKDVPFSAPPEGSICATVALMRHGGSHLLRPIVAAFLAEKAKAAGVGEYHIVEPGNFNAPLDKAFGPVIFFPRDPRTRCASMVRFNIRYKPAKRSIMYANGTEKDQIMATLLDSEPFIPEMLRWAQVWAKWPDALRVNYEEMENRETAVPVVGAIAEWLGLEADPKHDSALLDAHFERSHTFNGEHSKWQDWFGPKSFAIWERDGGPELLNLLGYVP